MLIVGHNTVAAYVLCILQVSIVEGFLSEIPGSDLPFQLDRVDGEVATVHLNRIDTIATKRTGVVDVEFLALVVQVHLLVILILYTRSHEYLDPAGVDQEE